MKVKFILFPIFLYTSISFGQIQSTISNMMWGRDKIHITFSNDSSTIHEVKTLYHNEYKGLKNEEVVYYPVRLDPEYINSLVRQNKDHSDSIDNSGELNKKNTTLWSALHNQIGGGYIHFINCLIYSLETKQLILKSPLMKRVETSWKPKPVTKTYTRTKKWSYYIPDNQKLAQKEYKQKQKNRELGDMVLLPASFTQLFLTTSEKEYKTMVRNNEFHDVAIVDMIRLLIGSNYLGQNQIDYIQSAVIRSILKYNDSKLPSVIIFDDFDAAVAISLNEQGYIAEKIIFNSERDLTELDKNSRIDQMLKTIQHINEQNKKTFETHLKNYYQ